MKLAEKSHNGCILASWCILQTAQSQHQSLVLGAEAAEQAGRGMSSSASRIISNLLILDAELSAGWLLG